MGRGKKKKKHNHPLGYNYHHRLPKSRGGSGDLTSGNMVKVDVGKHRAFHHLFSNGTPQDIARILTETWIPREWELVARRRNR